MKMWGFCSPNRIFAFLAILIAATALHAQDGWRDAVLRLQSSYLRSSGPFGLSLVTADFNHDGHPDGALLLRSGNRAQIEVYFRSHQVRRFSFPSNLADLAISARDVNEDGSPDLVIESPFCHRALFVWLNDGSGEFNAGSVIDYPPDPEGAYREVVSSLQDWDRSALTESSRMRTRHSPGYLDRQTSVPSAISFIGESVRIPRLAHNSPNLVRGSPVLISL